MSKYMFAPDGYYDNGTNRPMKKVEILQIVPTIPKKDSTVWFKYCDSGLEGWTFLRLLKEDAE